MRKDRHYYREFAKFKGAAERETGAMLKTLPPEFADRIKDVNVRYVDEPTKEMIDTGVADDALSLTNREAKEILVFVMNLKARYAARPGEFRENLRRVLAMELCDWAGVEMPDEV